LPLLDGGGGGDYPYYSVQEVLIGAFEFPAWKKKHDQRRNVYKGKKSGSNGRTRLLV